jgi:hypothetical protein
MALLFVLGASLTRGRVSQWSESHTLLLSHLRLLGSLSVASYDSQGLRWKYCNPPPHGELVSDKFSYQSKHPRLLIVTRDNKLRDNCIHSCEKFRPRNIFVYVFLIMEFKTFRFLRFIHTDTNVYGFSVTVYLCPVYSQVFRAPCNSHHTLIAVTHKL